MREILFRGKRMDNGEWVEGGYKHEKVGEYFTAVFIIEHLTNGVWENHRVDPATVGQYIGLKDEHGKRIFERDIIKHYNRIDAPDDYEVGIVFFDAKTACFKRTTDPHSVFVGSHCRYEVIGTVYDKPELLEGGDDDV